MSLELFIAARSGIYNEAGELTHDGEIQAMRLGKALVDIVHSRRLLVLYSLVGRVRFTATQETAELCAKLLKNLAVEELPDFGLDAAPSEARHVLKRAAEEGAEGVLVVHGADAGRSLSQQMSMHMFAEDKVDSIYQLRYGGCTVLDRSNVPEPFQVVNPDQRALLR